MATEPLPIIDLTRCTGCGRCVEVCPTQALAQVAGKAALRYPERCTYCTACEDICPENAIALPFMIVLAQPADFELRDLFPSHPINNAHDKGVNP